MRTSRGVCRALVFVIMVMTTSTFSPTTACAERFAGQYFRGEGDIEYLQLLDLARRMFEPDPEFQNMGMFYTPAWNGLVEGPTWGAWWVQNSYGPTYCALPFWQEPFLTFVQNSQDLWFDQMGDGQRVGANSPAAPDGCLCDCAVPGKIYYKQGDVRPAIHDWGMEFTAAGLVLQTELLLTTRDGDALARYLPKLERAANFIETRRDPENNLFLAGPAGNLLAPSYAGWKKPDGTYDKAYLAGLSITYIAGLDRLIELEKMAGNDEKVQLYTQRRELARKGLPLLTTDEGYFIKSLDRDGTRHGVYGAEKHGYFEAVCNHDAICFRVVDDVQAEKIYAKIASIPGLRPYDLIITNYPSLDDMYEQPKGLWEFGFWVNGGHWSTCEARMIMGYYRLGKYDDARRSMKRILGFAQRFRMDNNLTNFGSELYQPKEPINCVYDSWGVPAALIRGLFEYIYRADGLTILPHIPPRITELQQRFPIRFGRKRLLLATVGSGPVTGVLVNGKPWKAFDATSVSLPYEQTPDEAAVQILLGGATARPLELFKTDYRVPTIVRGEATVKGAKLFPVISTNNLPLRIGANTNPDAANRFVGEIAQPLVFNRPLSDVEIARLAQDQIAGLDKDQALVGRWDLAARQDDLFPNMAIAQLPAKVVGPVTLADSVHGIAIQFDGRGYLEVDHDPRLNLARGLTLAAWIRRGKLTADGGRVFDKNLVDTDNGYMVDVFPAGLIRFIIERGVLTGGTDTASNQWVHVAVTAAVDGSQAMYVNGKLVAEQKREVAPQLAALDLRSARLRRFHDEMMAAGLAESYEAGHARLALRYLAVTLSRLEMLTKGKLKGLPEPSQYAADKSYFVAAARLGEGLEKILDSYVESAVGKSADPQRKRIFEIWVKSK